MQTFLSHLSTALQGRYSSDEIRVISRELLYRCCQYPENEILWRKDIKISPEQHAVLQKAVEALQKSMPLQYVTGVCRFYDTDFKVVPPVLIPRPETEELLEWILKDASHRASKTSNASKSGSGEKSPSKFRVLDVGTGSGCLAVSIAKHLSDSRVEAWDILPEAVALARENALQCGVDVEVKQCDLFAACAEISDNLELPSGEVIDEELFDVIVSNPPYVCQTEQHDMAQNVLDYESPLALFVPDDDALKYYRALLKLSMKSLKTSGCLYVEINRRFGRELCRLYEPYFAEVILRKDISGNDRMIKAIRK